MAKFFISLQKINQDIAAVGFKDGGDKRNRCSVDECHHRCVGAGNRKVVIDSKVFVQIVAFENTDKALFEMCLAEIQRRAKAEQQLQEKYALLLSLRDDALHNKNMLQK